MHIFSMAVVTSNVVPKSSVKLSPFEVRLCESEVNTFKAAKGHTDGCNTLQLSCEMV